MKTSILLLIALAMATYANAQDPQTLADNAAKAAYYMGKDGRATVTMQITDKQGRERTRELVILRRDVDEDLGDQQFYVYFRQPTDVADTAFLDLVRRIAASDERTSFVGSHFFYEDVSGRSPLEDNHELLEETDNYYVLKSTPKEKGAVEFAYFKSWIHKSTFIAVKSEYYDSNNEPYRSYEALKVETIDGFPTVTQSKMNDLQRAGSTTLTYAHVEYDIGIAENIFSERYLRNPPANYLEY
jgi:hypothetical protein